MYSSGLINGLVYRNGSLTHENIYIDGEKIKKITSNKEKHDCSEEINCEGKIILPGFIDPHVHLNLNLGEFISADDYESGSIAAAFGGVTTFIDFLEPISFVSEFKEKFDQKLEESKLSHIDFSFHTTVGNYKDKVDELVKISLKHGIPSIKLFTTYSESDRKISDEKLKELLQLSKVENLLILIHAENDNIILNSKKYEILSQYESSRPVEAELKEVEKLSTIVKETEGRAYIVHLTTGTALEFMKEDCNDLLGKNLFLESCPQYFWLTREVYKRDDGRLFLLAPPLRSKKEQEKLRKNIDLIHTIGTDHCPFTKEEKYRYSEVSKVPKGIGGIEYSFSLMYNLFGTSIIDKFTVNPAKIHGLYPQKGVIQEDSDADLVIFDPNRELTIDAGHSKSDYSPYEGIKVRGVVESTILRGQFLVKERKFVGKDVKGTYLKRKHYNF
ncbi:MAG: dihydroorotase [Candidatus Heimdallarchaeaceae archaeon]